MAAPEPFNNPPGVLDVGVPTLVDLPLVRFAGDRQGELHQLILTYASKLSRS